MFLPKLKLLPYIKVVYMKVYNMQMILWQQRDHLETNDLPLKNSPFFTSGSLQLLR